MKHGMRALVMAVGAVWMAAAQAAEPLRPVGPPVRLMAAPVVSAEEQRVTDAVRDLGFAVRAVVRGTGNQWEVQVEGFDPARATRHMRGAVQGPAVGFGRPGAAALAGGDVRGGIRPGGGIRASGDATGGGPEGATPGRDGGPLGGRVAAGDGSATGGGQGGPEGATPGRDGGPIGGGDPGGGKGGGEGSATGGSPGPARSAGGRDAVVRVTTDAQGGLVVDAASLQALGLAAGKQQVLRGNVSIR